MLHSDAREHVAEVLPSVHHSVWLAVRALPDLSPRDPVFLQIDYAVERSVAVRLEERETNDGESNEDRGLWQPPDPHAQSSPPPVTARRSQSPRSLRSRALLRTSRWSRS